MKKIFFAILVCWAVLVAAQGNKQPTLSLYKVKSGDNFITVEFFTTKAVYAKYEVIRTDGNKAKSLGIYAKKYSVADTVVFFYTDTNVKPGTLYQYAFIPMDENGVKSPAGEPVFAATKVFTSYYFRQTLAKASTKTLGIDVRWKLSSIDNIKAVDLYRSEKSDTGFERIATLPSTDTLYSDFTVVPDKVYFYKLSGKNFITNEVFESAAFFDLGMPTTKSLNPVIQGAVQTDKGVEVKIDASEKFLSAIRLYRKVNGTDKFILVAALPADSTVMFLDSTVLLTPGDYVYTATTENVGRYESDFSNQVEVHVAATTVADYAGDFTADYDNTRVRLFWDKLDFNQFKVKRTEVGTNTQLWLNGGRPLFGNRYTDSTVLPAKKYEYVLYAMNENGVAGKGVTAVVETPNDGLVSNQSLRGVATGQGVVLEWGDVADRRIVKQRLYRYQPGTTPAPLATFELKEKVYKDATAAAGEIYRYYLVSVDSKGKESQPGNEIAVRAQQK